jgi:hypothetical protein
VAVEVEASFLQRSDLLALSSPVCLADPPTEVHPPPPLATFSNGTNKNVTPHAVVVVANALGVLNVLKKAAGQAAGMMGCHGYVIWSDHH